MTIKEVFSRNLRAFRRKLGFTQPQLAKRLGVSRNTVIEWEKPDVRLIPYADRLDALAALDPQGVTPVGWFFIDWEGDGLAFLEKRVKAEEMSIKRRLRIVNEFKELRRNNPEALDALLRMEGIKLGANGNQRTPLSTSLLRRLPG